MKNEYSAGVIVYHDDSLDKQRRYLLLMYPKGYWDLPKGHLELNESNLEAALRELKEETNLEADIASGFEQSLFYNFRGFNKEPIYKQVVFFVGKAVHKNVILSEEHLGYKWLSFDEAIDLLTFDNAKNMVTAAEAFLKNNLS